MPNYYSSRLKKEKSRSRRKQIIMILIALLIMGGAITGYLGYRMVYKPNVWLNGQASAAFNIKSGSTWEDVKQMLQKWNDCTPRIV